MTECLKTLRAAFREYTLSTLFLRAKTKQAKIAKNQPKCERVRYILTEFRVLDIKWE